MYCDRRGNGQKPIRTKPPGQKLPRTIEIEFVQGTFVKDFCTRPTKNRGSEMCDVFSGVPGCVTKCDRGGGSKLAKNSVTYFMDGPYALQRLNPPLPLFLDLPLQPRIKSRSASVRIGASCIRGL